MRSLKIILGTESFPPNISGAAIYTHLLTKYLAQKGHKIWVLTPLVEKRSLDKENFKVISLPSFPNPFRRGFRVAFLPRVRIAKIVKEIKPDLIHLHSPVSICSSLLKIGQRERIPVVATHHFSLEFVLSYLGWLKLFSPFVRKVLCFYLSRFYNQCALVLIPTKTVARDLKNFGVISPLKVISHGVDLKRFSSLKSDFLKAKIRTQFGLEAKPIVLYLGRIDVDKNIETLIGAIPFVLKKKGAHFIFVGSGDKVEFFKNLAKQKGLKNSVSFLGPIPHESPDLPKIYQMADIFVNPSAIETQSLVVLEAMATGLPIVAANSGALPEIVRNGKNGFLFPAIDSSFLAQKIIILLKDEKLAKKMGKESLKMVTPHDREKNFRKVESRLRTVARINASL